MYSLLFVLEGDTITVFQGCSLYSSCRRWSRAKSISASPCKHAETIEIHGQLSLPRPDMECRPKMNGTKITAIFRGWPWKTAEKDSLTNGKNSEQCIWSSTLWPKVRLCRVLGWPPLKGVKELEDCQEFPGQGHANGHFSWELSVKILYHTLIATQKAFSQERNRTIKQTNLACWG